MTPQLENGKFKRDGVRKMRLFLIDEDEGIELSLEESLELDVANKVVFKIKEKRIEIGSADVEHGANGALIIDLFMAGMWTDPAIMSECLTMKGFIRTEMRKD
jgi:hypothetical protein